jgi:hypothetical protein
MSVSLIVMTEILMLISDYFGMEGKQNRKARRLKLLRFATFHIYTIMQRKVSLKQSYISIFLLIHVYRAPSVDSLGLDTRA